jgi:hypothetical protein
VINHSESWFYLTKAGDVHEGDDPPDGSTVLAAPGATVDDATVAAHEGLEAKMAGKKGAKDAVHRDGAGNPVVVRGGKAVAADIMPEGDEEAAKVMEAAGKEDEVKAKEDEKAAREAADEAHAADVEAAREKVKAADAKGRAKAPEGRDADEPAGRVVKADASGKALHLGDAGVQDKSVKGPDAGHARKGK